MKIVAIGLVMLLLGFALGFGVCFMRGKPYLFVREQSDTLKAQFGLFPKPIPMKPTLFLMGDSLVKRGDWTKLEANYAPVNLGQGGARVKDVIGYLKASSETVRAQVFFWVGVNNLADRSSLDEIMDDYRRLLDLAESRELDVTVISLPCVKGKGEFDRRASILALNEQLFRLTESVGANFFEVNDYISDKQGVIYGYTSDDLHLTIKGYDSFVGKLTKD